MKKRTTNKIFIKIEILFLWMADDEMNRSYSFYLNNSTTIFYIGSPLILYEFFNVKIIIINSKYLSFTSVFEILFSYRNSIMNRKENTKIYIFKSLYCKNKCSGKVVYCKMFPISSPRYYFRMENKNKWYRPSIVKTNR